MLDDLAVVPYLFWLDAVDLADARAGKGKVPAPVGLDLVLINHPRCLVGDVLQAVE